jgi:Co/Zn/Cd efflux system component
MEPTRRELLGAALLTAFLVLLVVLIFISAIPPEGFRLPE